MSKIHVLQADDLGGFRVVLHTPVPSGNNAAGLSIKSVLLAAEASGFSTLTEGTEPGQITAAENLQVTAGNILEFTDTIRKTQGGLAAIEAEADRIIAEHIDTLARQYQQYGRVL